MPLRQDHNSESFLFLRAGEMYERVTISNITYLKAEGSYSKFITTEKEYMLSGNLNRAHKKLKNPVFIRIHRSYVVNIERVTGLDSNHVFVGDLSLPIGRSYREKVGQYLRKIS